MEAGFGRHGTLPPASKDMYSILFPELRGRDETYRRCELVTLTFDLETGPHCGTCHGVGYLLPILVKLRLLFGRDIPKKFGDFSFIKQKQKLFVVDL